MKNRLNTIPLRCDRFPARPVILLLSLSLLVIPAACESVGAGVFAGPAHACPGNCTCMPEAQAERLGYTPCSPEQSPCFHGATGQPLYCYRPPESPCGQECAASPAQSASGAGITVNPSLISPVNETLVPALNDSSFRPGQNGSGRGAVAPGLPDMIIGFFRSLLGLK